MSNDFLKYAFPAGVIVLWFGIILSDIGIALIYMVPWFALIGAVGALLYFLKQTLFPLSHPLSFEFDDYNLSQIGAKVHGKPTPSIFFAELLRLNDRRIIEIKPLNSGFTVKKNKLNSLAKLSPEQQVIYDTLPNLFESHLEWEKKIREKKIVKIDLSTKKYAFKKGIRTFFIQIIASLFVPVFSIVLFFLFFASAVVFVRTDEKSYTLFSRNVNALSEELVSKLATRVLITYLILVIAFVYFSHFLFNFSTQGPTYYKVFIFAIVALVSFCWIFFPQLSAKKDEKDFILRVRQSLTEFSDLEESDNLNYFIMYGEQAAWAIACGITTKKSDAQIQKMLGFDH